MRRTRQVRFGAGSATAAVGTTTVALIDADPLDGLSVRLVDAVVADSSFEAIVELLLDAGAAALPDLAVVQVVPSDRSVRTLARGALVIELTMTSDLAAQRWDAMGVTTWTERRDVDVAAVALRIADDLSTPGPYRVAFGVVPAGVIAFDLDDILIEPTGVAEPAPDLDSLRPPIATPGVARSSMVSTPATDLSDPVAPTPEQPDPVGPEQHPGPVAPASEPSTWMAPEVVEQWAPPAEVAATPPSEPEVDAVEEEVDEIKVAAEAIPDDTGDQSSTIVFDPGASRVAPAHSGESEVELDTLGVASAASHMVPATSPEAPVHSPERLDGASDGQVGDDDADDEFDHLFGATQFRPVSAAGLDDPDQADVHPSGPLGAVTVGVADAGAAVIGADSSEPPLGDHDGMTISLAELRALAANSAVTLPPAVSGQMVHAVQCVDGHLNPPSAVSCRACGVEIPAQAHASVPRPRLGRLVFSHGDERVLDRPLLLGRSPKTDGPVGAELPELVVLPSPTKELSGTHLEVRLEGWQVVVVDRRSTNGTTVQLPLTDPQRLHPGEPFPIVPGTVVDLAEEIQFTFEVDP